LCILAQPSSAYNTRANSSLIDPFPSPRCILRRAHLPPYTIPLEAFNSSVQYSRNTLTHLHTPAMEYSSPLAAMRPQPYPTWGSRRDMPIHRAIYNSTSAPYDFSSFDFRNMSMNQQPLKPTQRDYFNLKPTRAHSSPTSSLTADLDANFHIDQRYGPHSSLDVPGHFAHHGSSPHLATPRRCLFTTTVIPPMGDNCKCQLMMFSNVAQ
jgi:hypothetical protein